MADETERLIRAKTRAEVRRTTAIASIRAVNVLALRTRDDPAVVPTFLANVGDLEVFWAQFKSEDDAVLERLIELGQHEQYSSDLAPEVRALVNECRSISDRLNTGELDDIKSKNLSEQESEKGADRFQTENRDVHRPYSRLPEIPLPKFDGDFNHWPTFRDRFTTLVESRSFLSNTEKFYYLIGCLHGPAADVIRRIPVSADNYELAWKTLADRFNRPRLVATALIDKLLRASVATQESLSDLNHFLSNFSEGISLLNTLQVPDMGSFLLFTIAFRCLPVATRKLFESSVSVDYPSVDDLLDFVQSRVSLLEIVGESHKSSLKVSSTPAASIGQKQPGGYNRSRPRESNRPTTLVATKSETICPCCQDTHPLISCPKFKSWSLDARSKWARDQRLCFRCLDSDHWAPRCHTSIVCAVCSRKHHTLVHKDGGDNFVGKGKVSGGNPGTTSTASLVGHLGSPSVLLGTVLVHIRDAGGALHTARALVDSASQISAITAEYASRLGLSMTRWTAPVSGLAGATVSNVQGIVDCQIQPRFCIDPVLSLKTWVFPSLTSDMPRVPLSNITADKYRNLALADPSFDTPSAINLLLGADVFAQVLNGKRITVGESLPVAFGSIFGWIIIGPVPNLVAQSVHACPVSLITSVETLLDKFWKVEEPEAAPEDFTDEGQCEAIFRDGCVRSPSGRFTVPLPFRQQLSSDTFRGSREVAIRRFECLESKLSADPRLNELYCQFMAEYIRLGHMSPASSSGMYYIPHHAIYRPSDTDPKIRVVFDASARSFSGFSLNSCLIPGPKLQREVIDVLLLFRLTRYAFTADICKMYRQILIAPEHRCYQHILWRASPHDQLLSYELNTVTYGVNCAPFLAIRVLRQIAEHDCSNFPQVKQALLFNTYVDDICVGADTEAEVLDLQSSLVTVLGRSGLELKKWSSNTPKVLDNVPPEDRAIGSLPFDDGETIGVKVLGLRWDHNDDSFCYTFVSEVTVNTKRGMLSVIARIFDPLGLLAPVVFLAKHFMQRVWQAEVSWDDPLPPRLADTWRQFVFELSSLQQLRVPRFVGSGLGAEIVLCGFCDASERGYAAVVYARVQRPDGRVSVSLVGTKTKLAPLNKSTIPRLELCAALLLARWMARIRGTLGIRLTVVDWYAWSDSEIVLSWLSVRHESFKVFVSNRIHKIQSLLPNCRWNHIASADNPADCASRGLSPSELLSHELYWKGPSLLSALIESWPSRLVPNLIDQLPERKQAMPTVLVLEEPEWYSRFSSYLRMLRVIVYVRRFIARCRQQPVSETYITRHELDLVTLSLVRSSQNFHFDKLRHELQHAIPVSVRTIARLRPFIDDREIIRVGGRLSRSELDDNQKYPILLSKSSHLSMLLVSYWHDITGHGGPRVLTALIGRQFWILSLRTLIRSVISHCTRCVRLSAVHPQPIMADLPRSRVSECRPFSRVGIDYAGPLSMTEHRLRKARQYKVYIAVFVCFVVKAVHLEVVSDLTTDSFLAALKRFVARRGLPTDIYTDCGTNFVGAANQLRNLLNDPVHRDRLSGSVHCSWHFNPPAAPHFGGLWEAAVRSAKTLLVRIMGEHTFTLEEFSTILCRVEAILNSRPLTPISSDPAEIECLTPGHFLIGQPLLAVPEDDITPTARSLLNRWKLVNQCVQSFWKRWRDEYLQTLQARGRWTSDTENLAVNDVVIIKEAHSPPLKWHMARVSELMPGADKVVRVVRLRTADGFTVRPVVKLVRLPTQ
jgi:hypothetical protein